MQNNEEEKNYTGLKLLPFGLLGVYYVLDYVLYLSWTVKFILLGVIIVISFTNAWFLLKKGVIDQPRKRLTIAAAAIGGSGIIFIVYLLLINFY